MSQHSDIQWTDATWNPTRGCSRVSEGCRHCYAEGIAFRFSGEGKPFEGFAKVTAPRDSLDKVGGRRNGWTGRVELIADKLTEPLSWRTPQKVFVNSMSDLFHENLPDAAIDQVFAVMALAPQHTFQVLTKRADRMRAYLSADRAELLDRLDAASDDLTHGTVGDRWPLPNVWLGVSVENQHFADERVPLLLQTPAAVRFISAEPLLDAVDLHRGGWSFLESLRPPPGNKLGHDRGLDWVIIGGESGPGARQCSQVWIRNIVRQCREAGVPVFVKQIGRMSAFGVPGVNGGFRPADRKGGDMAEWPEDLRIREFPEARA